MLLVSLMSCFGNTKGKASLGERHGANLLLVRPNNRSSHTCHYLAQRLQSRRPAAQLCTQLHCPCKHPLCSHISPIRLEQSGICLRSQLDGTGQGLRDGKSDVDPHRFVRLPYIVFGRMPLPVSIPRECWQPTRAVLPPFQLHRGIFSTKTACFAPPGD